MATLLLTLVGPDRPGVVRQLAAAVAAHHGNWLESRMARLGGQFAGIALVAIPEAETAAFRAGLGALEAGGLRVLVQAGEAAPQAPAHASFRLELLGQDRPGIVRDISAALALHQVNIEELTTEILSGSFSGEHLFRAELRLRVPPAASLDAVRAELERLGNELMVDLNLNEAPADG